MKKAISTLVLSTLVLMSCSNPVEELTNEAIVEVKSQLLDPESFEVIETQVDTLKQSWKDTRRAQLLLTYHEFWNDQCEEMKRKTNWEISFGSTSLAEDYMEIWQTAIDSSEHYLDRYQTEMGRISKMTNTPSDTNVAYVVAVRYYANSRGGNRVIGEQHYYSYLDGKTNLEKVEI